MDFIYDHKYEFKLLTSPGCCGYWCRLILFIYVDSGKRAWQNSIDTVYIFLRQIYKNDRKSTFLGAFASELDNDQTFFLDFSGYITKRKCQTQSHFFWMTYYIQLVETPKFLWENLAAARIFLEYDSWKSFKVTF